MINFVKRRKYFLILCLGALFFFFVYSFLSFSTAPRFVSPDEMANYFFTKKFAQETKLIYSESLEVTSNNIIYPRSTAVVSTVIVPDSFTGIMLWYGFLAKILGIWIIRYLTPFIAAAAILFFYLLIKDIFGKTIGFISALFLLINPAYWYNATRSMMHNVLFLSLFIISAYYLLKLVRQRSQRYFILYGVFTVLALTVRTSEVFWVFLIMLTILILFSRIRRSYFITILASLVVFFAFFLVINKYLYHSTLISGYSPENVDISLTSSNLTAFTHKIGSLLLPFGLNINNIFNNLGDYFIKIFPWFSIFTILGILATSKKIVVSFIKRKWNQEWRGEHLYFILYLLIFIWLAIYYGSWYLKEYIDPKEIILGSSFLRYWLPLYVFGLPYTVMGVLLFKNIFKERFRRVVSALIIIFVVVYSAWLVIGDPLYGLAKVKKDILEYQQINQKAVAITPADAVIIAGTSDKIFFPERRVIVDFKPLSKDYQIALKRLSQQVPIYYYCLLFDETCQELRKENQTTHFQLSQGTPLSKDSILYKIDIRY